MDFSGVFAALTTPFAADDSVAIADLKKNIQLYNATGLAGYAVQGSTGESVLLSRAEWDSVLVAAKEAASPQKKLLAGTGVESTAETISRSKRAAELGYHAALVKTGKIDLIINTPLGRESFYDEKSIRRAAIRYNIPCITTLAAAHAAARGIRALVEQKTEVSALQDLHRRKVAASGSGAEAGD